MFRNGNKEETPSLPVEPPATAADLRKQVEQLKADLQAEREKNEKLFTTLHGKQAEVEEASEDSKKLRSILRAEKMNFQHLAEISQKCIDKGILPAHKWDQEARMEAYSTAAKIIEEAINPTVVAPPPRDGLLKAHQQIADYMNQAARELTGEESGSGPGIEKGHEFPPTPCPFCDEKPAKNWLSRHIKEKHPQRYNKWEREREENE